MKFCSRIFIFGAIRKKFFSHENFPYTVCLPHGTGLDTQYQCTAEPLHNITVCYIEAGVFVIYIHVYYCMEDMQPARRERRKEKKKRIERYWLLWLLAAQWLWQLQPGTMGSRPSCQFFSFLLSPRAGCLPFSNV